jgi:cysteine desulfurase / selenocysteine lyase
MRCITMKNPDWKDIRKNYPITKTMVYFNNTSMGPLPANLRNVWEKFFVDWSTQDVTQRFHVNGWEPLRTKLAQFLGADYSEIGFCQSTSEGVTRASQSIKFEFGDNIVVPRNEFPANVIPWKIHEKDGVEIRYAGGNQFYVSESEIMDCCDERTKCVAASAVSFASGYRVNLSELSKFCHDRDIYFFSDIIQACGSMAINLGESQVDMAAFEAVKWIPSSSGTGVFFCSNRILDKMKLHHLGWMSVERSGLDDLLDFELAPYKSARRYDCGSSNMLGMMGLEVLMDYYLEIGIENIETRVLYLVDLLINGLENLGYEILSCKKPEKRSGILFFAAPEPQRLVEYLKKQWSCRRA